MTVLRRHRRWAVPALALAGVLSLGAAPSLFPASAAVPRLAALSPAQLLVKARSATVTALSGTVSLTSRLGIPSLGGLGAQHGNSSITLTTLLAGTHEVELAVNGADHVRISQQSPLAETLWVRNGQNFWSWDSTSQRVIHALIPARKARPHQSAPEQAQAAARAAQDPTALAAELLANLTPSTEVSVRSPRYVAGHAVYELVLTPKTAVSTVREVVISVDAITGLPIDVRIFARSARLPAFELGFTKLSYDPPSAATFAFTPPPGATLVEASSPRALLSPGAPDRGQFEPPSAGQVPAAQGGTRGVAPRVRTVGTDWATVSIISGVTLPRAVLDLVRNAPEIAVGVTRGRLITTTLLNVLVLDDGRIAVGALTPAALEAAAGTASA